MKINVEAGAALDVQKAIGVQGSSFELESTMPLIERREVQPMLLTALLVGSTQVDYLTGDTFVYDEDTAGKALPNGKRYDEYGNRITKEKARTLRYGVPSFGISGNVAPKDWANKRKAGTTNEYMQESDVLVKVNAKLGSSWGLMMEKQLLTLVTTDTNSAEGGPFEEVNFYTDILTGTRSNDSVTFSNANIDQIDQLRTLKKKLMQEAQRAGEVQPKFVCLCSSGFFQKRLILERQEDTPRELRSTYDFVSQEVTSNAMTGTQSFEVDNFVGSQDGIHYIEYSASIDGVAIAANQAVLIPVQAENFIRVPYAPSQDRENANTVAQEQYGWQKVSSKQGVTIYEESNYLTAMVNPRLMRRLIAD